MFQKYRLILEYIVVLAFLLFGCVSSNESNNFQNLVFPDKCKNACWMGIEPTISTTDDTMKILKNVYGSANVTSDKFRKGSGSIDWNMKNPNWQSRGSVSISNNKVDSVLVWFPENGMAVKDIIKGIGSPDSVGVIISETILECAGASLLYPQVGLGVFLSSSDKSVGVTESQIINGLDIRPPWTSDNYPWHDTKIFPWDGYHEYCPQK